MKSKISKVVLAVTASLSLWSCYPDGAQFYEETDLTFTQYDVDFDFSLRQTYSIPDKIVVDVEIDNGDTTFIYMKDVYAKPILQTIETNMGNFGWTKVDISQRPDMVVTPAATKNTTVFYSYWYDWWYGGWYGGWGWYYPPYYVSSYTTGTVFITMADPNADNPINSSRVAWMMAGSGLASGTGDINRITNAIDQAFVQSPYLKID